MDYLPLDIAKDLAHSFEKQREAGMHLTIRGSSNSQGHTPQLVNCRPQEQLGNCKNNTEAIEQSTNKKLAENSATQQPKFDNQQSFREH